MAKPKRKVQQHLRQQSTRKRTYVTGGVSTNEKFKTPFPMNLLSNAKIFYWAGAAIMVGGVILAAVLASQGATPSADADDFPTATPASPTSTPDPNASPTPTGTPDAKRFTAAEQVITAQSKNYQARFKTDKGEFVMTLFDDKSPNTVNVFVFLAQKGYYDGIKFHRIQPNFVAQAGDPAGTGSSDYPGFETQQEANDLTNKTSYVAMARRPGSTAFGSQFYINLKDNPSLDQDAPNQARFYPFAQVTQGMDVVMRLAQGDVIQSVTIEELPQQ